MARQAAEQVLASRRVAQKGLPHSSQSNSYRLSLMPK